MRYPQPNSIPYGDGNFRLYVSSSSFSVFATAASSLSIPTAEQVLHYDEICLHSNRWQRSVRAHPTQQDQDRAGTAAAAATTAAGAAAIGLSPSTRQTYPGAVSCSGEREAPLTQMRMKRRDPCSCGGSCGGVAANLRRFVREGSFPVKAPLTMIDNACFVNTRP